MIAPDLLAVGPWPTVAAEAGRMSPPAGGGAAPALPIRVILTTGATVSALLGGLQLREQGSQLAQALAAAARAELDERPLRFPEGLEEAIGRLGHVGVQQQRGHPQALGQAVEDGIEPARCTVLLGELPRAGLLDVAVEPADELPDLLERLGDLGLIQKRPDAVGDSLELTGELRLGLRVRDRPVAVAADHRENPVGEVPVLVGELGLVAGLEACRRDLAVLSEGDLPEAV